MIHPGDLSENMRVRARGGEPLGSIIRIDDRSILVERGISMRDYEVPLEEVREIVDGDVYLSVTEDEVRAGAGSKFARRTLGDESSRFAHEADALDASSASGEGER